MKALILKGKCKGLELEVSQWCNDWFTVIHQKQLVMSPSSLALTSRGMSSIRADAGSGSLFDEYEVVAAPKGSDKYRYTFRRKKPSPPDRIIISEAQAISLMNFDEADEVHVFHNPGGILVGFDVGKTQVLEALHTAASIEIGGEMCMKMKHAIVVIPPKAKQSDVWFIQHDEKKIAAFLKEPAK